MKTPVNPILTGVATIIFGLSVWSAAAMGQGLAYPQARKSNQTDVYFGVRVADPYRWMEDDS